MSPNNKYQLESAIHHNLFRLGLIRAVVVLGQCLGLIYFSVFKPLGLATTEIALVLAIYTSISIATAKRSRLKIPIQVFIQAYQCHLVHRNYCKFRLVTLKGLIAQDLEC